MPDAVSPTARWQDAVWGALGERLQFASPNTGTFDDLFRQKVEEAARLWGVSPEEANLLMWQGNPFDVPLGTDLIPPEVWKQLGRFRRR